MCLGFCLGGCVVSGERHLNKLEQIIPIKLLNVDKNKGIMGIIIRKEDAL